MKAILEDLVQQLTADKKKLGVMLGALAIGLLLWGRLLLQDVPRTATADNPVAAAKTSNRKPSSPVVSPQSDDPLQVVHVDLPTSLRRDPFVIDPSRYRRTQGGTAGVPIAKSTQLPPDGDSRVEAVREEAVELELESIVTGQHPRAYINGHLLALGDEYNGFKLIRVMDRHVILTKYGLFIRLRM